MPLAASQPVPTIFISYPHEDYVIASKIEAAIKKLEGNKFDVILDQSFIEGGQEITATIEENLDRTVYFVSVGTSATRDNYSWCGLELGYFRAVRRRASLQPVGDITCLFHDEAPELFQPYKCFRIIALDSDQRSELGDTIRRVEDAPVYHFLTDIANRHNNLFPARNAADFFAAAAEWAEKWAGEITKAYIAENKGAGIIKWNVGMINLMFEAQAETAFKQAKLLLNDRVFRIDVMTKPGEFALDDATPDKIDRLMNLGWGEAVKKENLQTATQRFFASKAPRFAPLHAVKQV